MRYKFFCPVSRALTAGRSGSRLSLTIRLQHQQIGEQFAGGSSARGEQQDSGPGLHLRQQRQRKLGRAHSYTWNADGQLAQVDGGVTPTYDALGRMVEDGKGSQILYGPGGGKLAVMNGQTLRNAFVPLPGGATAVFNASGLAYYRHPDWLGSSRFASTPTAPTGMYSSKAYAPFGEVYGESGTQDHSFAGHDEDTTTGIYDAWFRRYSPVQSRWLSPDPAGLAAVNLGNPQSWNRYAYTLGKPLSLIDPLGMQAGSRYHRVFIFDDGCGVGCVGPDGMTTFDRLANGGCGAECTYERQVNCAFSGTCDIQFQNGSPVSVKILGACVSASDSTGTNINFGCDSPTTIPWDQWTSNMQLLSASNGSATHICGDFVCDSNNKQVGVAPPEIRGIHPTNIEFDILLGGFYLSPGLPWWWHIWNGPKWPF